MRKALGSAGHMHDVQTLLERDGLLAGIAVIAIERVGLSLPAWSQAREIAIVRTSGTVFRWLCAPETHWRRDQPVQGANTLKSGRRSATPDSGWGLDPTEVVAGLSPALERVSILAAAEPEAVKWWLTLLYGFVGQPIPCQVRPIDDLYSAWLPGLDRIRIVGDAMTAARQLHSDTPHPVTEATRAIESLRKVAYRLESSQTATLPPSRANSGCEESAKTSSDAKH